MLCCSHHYGWQEVYSDTLKNSYRLWYERWIPESSWLECKSCSRNTNWCLTIISIRIWSRITIRSSDIVDIGDYEMLEITSTPLVIMAILGTVGILIPIISIARKEQGSNSFYAVIAFAALIVSMGYVGYQFVNDNVAYHLLFSQKMYL